MNSHVRPTAELLRDGRIMRIRPLRDDDGPAVRRLHQRASARLGSSGFELHRRPDEDAVEVVLPIDDEAWELLCAQRRAQQFVTLRGGRAWPTARSRGGSGVGLAVTVRHAFGLADGSRWCRG